MRDVALLAFMLLVMRRLGGDRAHLVRDGRSLLNGHAGSQPLNRQGVRDLLNDGWLRLVEGDSGQIRIDAWPCFATLELLGGERLEPQPGGPPPAVAA